MKKSDLKILKERLKKILKEFLTSDKIKEIFEYENIDIIFDKIIENLIKPSYNNKLGLNTNEINFLKRILGICSNNKNLISNENAVFCIKNNRRYFAIILEKIYINIKELIAFIEKYYHVCKNVSEVIPIKKKMSSLVLKKNSKNYLIGELGLSLNLVNKLKIKGIFDLYDLLSYSKIELFNDLSIGYCSIEKIEEMLVELDLKFIDDLIDKEKKLIISKYNSDVVGNSSIYWVLNKKFISKNFKKKCFLTIKDIIKLDYKENKKIFNYLKSLGIDNFENNVDYDKLIHNSYEDLINLEFSRINLSYRLQYFLKKNNIVYIKDVIFNSKKKLPVFEKTAKYELIDVIHKLGLFFEDEKLEMKTYLLIIRENLQSDEIKTKSI